MAFRNCSTQYGPVLKAGQELSRKIHKVNDIFNDLNAQVVSNMHDIKALLGRIEELEKKLENKLTKEK
jgi:hypothetical protein